MHLFLTPTCHPHPAPPPRQYSSDLQAVVKSLLCVNPDNRPSVAEVLCLPVLRRHIASYALAALGGFSVRDS